MPFNYFKDDSFQLQVLTLICKDKTFLADIGEYISTDDFKPIGKVGHDRWILSSIALEFWQKHRAPVRELLQSEVAAYARRNKMSEHNAEIITELAATVLKTKIISADAILEKIKEYKKERTKLLALEELTEAQEQGELTDEKWIQVFSSSVDMVSNGYRSVDYFDSIEGRIARRSIRDRTSHRPVLMIDPLDELISYIGPGSLGMWAGYLKMGKSLALMWTAGAYCLQGLNVLYLTLEDPLEEVENRMDAMISCLPIAQLADLPKTLRRRWGNYRNLIESKLQIVDCTEDPPTVSRIQDLWEKYRRKGFAADSTIIDYDDEIRATKKQPERRFEFADIYRDLRLFAAKKHQILWTGATTNAQSEGKKIIVPTYLAEDISKARKVHLGIGIGQAEYGDNSKHLHVFAHKFDKQGVHCDIISNPSRGIFFDREATVELITNA